MTFKLKNIPIYIAYYCYPLLGVFGHVFSIFYGKTLDLFWLIPPLVLFFTPVKELKFKYRNEKVYVIFFTLFFVLKFALGWLLYRNQLGFQLMPFVTEIKGWIFLIVGYLWLQRFSVIETKDFIIGGVFLSWLYILMSVFIILRDGYFHRTGLGSETNYDGFLMLMSYVGCFTEKNTKWKKIILVIATFLTLSRTGLLSLVAITMYFNRTKFKYWAIVLPFAMFIGLSLIFSGRGGVNLEIADRFVFWAQAFLVFESMSWAEYLFGVMPGVPLRFEDTLPMMDWFVAHFEEILGIRGMHPMIFHGFWLRSALVIGLPFTLWFIFWNIKNLISKSASIVVKGLSILILLQGFSMAIFHLSLIGVPLIVFLLSNIKTKYEFQIQ